jgi:hypothetical protein
MASTCFYTHLECKSPNIYGNERCFSFILLLLPPQGIDPLARSIFSWILISVLPWALLCRCVLPVCIFVFWTTNHFIHSTFCCKSCGIRGNRPTGTIAPQNYYAMYVFPSLLIFPIIYCSILQASFNTRTSFSVIHDSIVPSQTDSKTKYEIIFYEQ